MNCNDKDELLIRLKKVEGQIRGLQRMIEEEKDCSEIVQQLRAAKKALDRAGVIILTRRLRQCAQLNGGEADTATEETMRLFLSLA